MSTPKSVIEMAKKNGARMVDIKFVDTFGAWQHFSCPINELTEEVFEEGLGFDGSSIRGWKSIEASDMLAIPDPRTAFIDPYCAVPTLSLTCTIAEPGTREPYTRDPRGIAQRAEKYLVSTGIADQAFFGPEAEFFIFDNVQYESRSNGTFYSVESVEGIWNSGRDEMPNLGNKIRHKEGYFPVAPSDTLQDLRTEMCLTMMKLGIAIERQHHEVATAGQAEIDYRFDTLLRAADAMMVYKYVVKNTARMHGKTACFMPKPLFGDNGSGMHTHQSLWKKGKPLFAGNEYGGLSQMALYYVGGLLKHARALCALCNPTTNSYKRLVPHFEAPVKLAYSAKNRSASIRIPYVANPKGRRVEARFPDPLMNPYLGFAALLMAGLDGVENKIHPGEAATKDLYHLPPEEDKLVPTVCHSLDQALEALDKDRGFLTKGGVFSESMIDAYIELKMTEVTRFRMAVHPVEYDMYYSL